MPAAAQAKCNTTLDMFGYAHTLMQETNNTNTVTDNAVDDDVGAYQVRQMSRWQV